MTLLLESGSKTIQGIKKFDVTFVIKHQLFFRFSLILMQFRVGVLQNAGIFFFKFFYIEVFSDPKIDKIKKIWLKKNLF